MTKKPQSSISFNTVLYLKNTLDDLYKNGVIDMYLYVVHRPESDTRKEHSHLYIQPSRPLNPSSLRGLFVEPDPDGSRCCLPFVTSKLGDWLLYALHDPLYLAVKGLSRDYSYSLSDLVSTEPPYVLEQFYNDAKEQYSNNRINVVLAMIREGRSYGDILSSGVVPPNQIVFYDKLYRSFSRDFVSVKDYDAPF